MAPTVEELSQKLNELTAYVEKQAQIVGKTGEQLIQMQVKDVKHRMSTLDSGPKADMDEYATNEDIVQLVGELQTQLDHLEERTIKRLINSRLTKADLNREIAPLTNKDGDAAPELYPKKVEDLLGLDRFSVVKLCEFFELIIPTGQDDQLNELLESGKFESVEEVEEELKKRNEQDIDKRIAAYSDREIDEMFDEFARYIGVNIRRHPDAW